LELDFVLYDKCIFLVGDWLVELGGDGMMSCLVLEHKTLVALNASEDGGLLDLPGADVLPFLLGVLLLGVRGLPSRIV
jgi:hypothetical protein